ncbi:MAG: response regulator transcription factor [Caulobacteraceae bacterium]|nr:response regulator transcription factor [Caulobacteraceae bacterium]
MMQEDAPRRVAIIEDDPNVLTHFTEIVSASPSLVVCATASSLAEAQRIVQLDPDIVLSDIGLPDGSGLDFIPELKRGSGCKVLVVTAFGDRDTVVAALSAGADGYLLKDSTPEAVVEGIQVTLMGGAPISASAAVYLLDRLRQSEPVAVPANDTPQERLTPREIELLQVFALGQSYKEAARSLGISPLTVGNHVKAIYRKLAVNSRGEAVYVAMQQGRLRV